MNARHVHAIRSDRRRFPTIPLLAFAIALLLVGPIGCSAEIKPPELTATALAEVADATRTSPAEETAEPVSGELQGEIVANLSISGQVATIDPQGSLSDDGELLVENLFAALARYDYQTGTVEPEMAESWSESDDGLLWTFNLRGDISWVTTATAGGFGRESAESLEVVRPVTADDVVLAARRACDSATSTPDVFLLFVIEGCEEVSRANGGEPANPESIGVRAIGDNLVEFTLNRPARHFPTLATLPMLRPVPAENLESYGQDWQMTEQLLTSGPFAYSRESVADSLTVLLRNPLWPHGLGGNVDKIEIVHVDADDAVDLWANRNLDLAPIPSSRLDEVMESHPDFIRQVAEQAVFYVAFDYESSVFAQEQVRRAFASAIDRDRLIAEVYAGSGLPLTSFAPPSVVGAPGYGEVGHGYDPDFARSEMALSSYGDCANIPLVHYMISSSDRALQQAELLRQMWVEELGCLESHIEIEQVQFGTLLSSTRINAGDARPDIWELGWASYYPDESNWTDYMLHCKESENRQMRPCDGSDELIERARAVDSEGQRLALYRSVEASFFSRSGTFPIVPLYQRVHPILQQSWLTYSPVPFGAEQLDLMHIDGEQKELETNRIQ